MKYLVIGDGFIGKQFKDYLNGYMLSQKIHSEKEILDALTQLQPQYVINCAGKTGVPNIDWCEYNKEETFFANVVLPTYIHNACKRLSIKMVHIGSGCIYQGDNGGVGFSETDAPNFDSSYYSWTKIVAERFLKSCHVLQIRIRMPINQTSHPRSLLTKLLSYKRIVNAENSITYIPDMLSVTEQLINQNCSGIFNVVNKNSITHKQILNMYTEISGKSLEQEFISVDELNTITLAKRSNCVLSTQKLESMNISIRDAKEAIRDCINKYVAENKS